MSVVPHYTGYATLRKYFGQCFQCLLATSFLVKLWCQHGPEPRGQTSKLSDPELVQSLVFHVLCGVGTLAAHVQQLSGVKVSDSDLSQRRAAAGVGVFETIVRAALRPLAMLAEHPSAFYRSWRLVAIDGSQTSVSNTPQLLRHLNKAASRRFQAAFAKVPLFWLVELGTHAPLVAVIGLPAAGKELAASNGSQLSKWPPPTRSPPGQGGLAYGHCA